MHFQVNNKRFSFKDLDIDEFDRVHRVNVRGVALCMRYVLETMSKQDERMVEGRSGTRSLGRGSIVNVGSLTVSIPER